jgi:hypothetical protein
MSRIATHSLAFRRERIPRASDVDLVLDFGSCREDQHRFAPRRPIRLSAERLIN